MLTLDRVHGVPVDDLAALDAAGIDRVALAEKGMRLFYTQVFRDNFFHADAHPGNIWVDPRACSNPRFIALDFGIMGSLPEARPLFACREFHGDVRSRLPAHRGAALRAGWMPAHIRVG